MRLRRATSAAWRDAGGLVWLSPLPENGVTMRLRGVRPAISAGSIGGVALGAGGLVWLSLLPEGGVTMRLHRVRSAISAGSIDAVAGCRGLGVALAVAGEPGDDALALRRAASTAWRGVPVGWRYFASGLVPGLASDFASDSALPESGFTMRFHWVPLAVCLTMPKGPSAQAIPSARSSLLRKNWLSVA